MSLEEVAISNMWEIAAILELLDRILPGVLIL